MPNFWINSPWKITFMFSHGLHVDIDLQLYETSKNLEPLILGYVSDPDGVVVVLPQSFSFISLRPNWAVSPGLGPTTRLAALDAGRIPNRKGTSRCV